MVRVSGSIGVGEVLVLLSRGGMSVVLLCQFPRAVHLLEREMLEALGYACRGSLYDGKQKTRQTLALDEYNCKPSCLGERVGSRKFPTVVRRGCKRSFRPRERVASCTGAKRGCTGAKEISEGARDSWETFAPWVQKTFCTLSWPHSGISYLRPSLSGGLVYKSTNKRVAKRGPENQTTKRFQGVPCKNHNLGSTLREQFGLSDQTALVDDPSLNDSLKAV